MSLLMLRITVLAALCLGIVQNSFKEEQLKYSRVRNAYSEKEAYVKELLAKKGINTLSNDIFIRAFKSEKILEVWVKGNDTAKYILLKSYEFCSSSGSIGPKRKQGDLQIPEGVYYINRFNPYSNFHLSLGLNYPNKSDRILGYKANLGGDIFIHGNCVTIGCIPITDDKIKELYILAVEAKTNGQAKIPVHLFPSKLDNDNFNDLKSRYPDNDKLIAFWKNLKEGYDFFEKHNKLPGISVNSAGKYVFKLR